MFYRLVAITLFVGETDTKFYSVWQYSKGVIVLYSSTDYVNDPPKNNFPGILLHISFEKLFD